MTKQELSAAEALRLALQHHQQGYLARAEAIYRRVLEVDPANAEALHLLGVIAYQTGKSALAVELITKAIGANPNVPDSHNNLGNALRALGKFEEAVSCFREALRLSPEFAEALNNLGLALRDADKLGEAVCCFQQALRLQPGLAEVHNNLGMTWRDLGKPDEAVSSFMKALRLRPDYSDAHNNLGTALRDQGKPGQAVFCYREALRLKPDLAEAHNNLGIVLREEGRLEDAIACYREALRLNPRLAEAHINLGAAFQDQGQMREAAEQFQNALALKPDNIAAQWGRCISQIQILYDNEQDILASRTRYRAELERLCGAVKMDNPRACEAAAQAVGGIQPFFLAYQGENDRELQCRYGQLVSRIQAARYPDRAQAPTMPARMAEEPLRIGIVSGFFCHHSNWKIPIKGWVENLDRRRFSLYGYYTGKKKDTETVAARRCFNKLAEDQTFDEICRAIRRDRLHVLIYPELGMDPMTLRLAALRLAPVQCTSWGHPDTSGLPTLDYYLSSDLMEPSGAEDHYSERLVRLPNLSIHYAPMQVEPAPLDRSAFGLRTGAALYLCAQSLFKYLPQHDDLLPRIARQTGDCQFVFLAFGKSQQVNERFLQRLARAFARYNLPHEDYVILLPQQDPAHYKALNRACDVFLDSIGWSGCNSTFEAIDCHLPVVTLPGMFMRGRHSVAILTMMGMTETVAASLDDYVRIAARLGRDAQWRQQLALRIENNKHRAYRDVECIKGLEAFIENAAAQHSS